MSITWIMVADGSRARLFENARRGEPLHQLDSFDNPAARMSGRRFTTGRPPTVNESVGPARHSIEPHTTLHDKHATRFAKALATTLENGRTAHRFQRLILVAPAKFLGALHECCDKPLRDCVAGEIGRDLVTLGPTQLHERIAHLLEPGVAHFRRA
jgi:protein required for attachment to host cells